MVWGYRHWDQSLSTGYELYHATDTNDANHSYDTSRIRLAAVQARYIPSTVTNGETPKFWALTCFDQILIIRFLSVQTKPHKARPSWYEPLLFQLNRLNFESFGAVPLTNLGRRELGSAGFQTISHLDPMIGQETNSENLSLNLSVLQDDFTV